MESSTDQQKLYVINPDTPNVAVQTGPILHLHNIYVFERSIQKKTHGKLRARGEVPI